MDLQEGCLTIDITIVGLLVLHPRNLLCNAPHGLPGLLPHSTRVPDAQSWTYPIALRTFPTKKKLILTLVFVLRWHTAALPRPPSCSFSIFSFRFRGREGVIHGDAWSSHSSGEDVSKLRGPPFDFALFVPTRVYRLSRNAVQPPRGGQNRA